MGSTHVAGLSLESATDASSYVTAGATPTVGELLVAWGAGSAVDGTATLTASANGITFTAVSGASVVRTTGERLHLFIADQLVPGSPASMTLTFSPGGSATGCDLATVSVSGLTRAGTSAVRSKGTGTGAGSTAPAVTMDQAALTTNPVLGAAYNATNPAGVTEPASFTEKLDTGHGSPARGLEYAARDSGHTSATVTWGGTSASLWAAIAVELDTSAASSPASATGSLSLSATGGAAAPLAGTGALALAATGGAAATLGGTAAVTLSGTGGGGATLAGAGALALAGSGGPAASIAGTGSLALDATGGAAATIGGSGSLALAGAGTGGATIAGAGALSLDASAGAQSTATGSGSLTLTGAATAAVGAVSSGLLTLTAQGVVGARAAGNALLSLLAAATAPTRDITLTAVLLPARLTATALPTRLTATLERTRLTAGLEDP